MLRPNYYEILLENFKSSSTLVICCDLIIIFAQFTSYRQRSLAAKFLTTLPQKCIMFL